MSYASTESPAGSADIKNPTTLTLDPLVVSALVGETTTFSGTLTETVTGNPIAGKTIHFFVDGVEGATAVTGADGSYSIGYTWEVAGTLAYKVKYLGD